MTDDEIKDLIRASVFAYMKVSDMPEDVLPAFPDVDRGRVRELMKSAWIAVSWDENTPEDVRLLRAHRDHLIAQVKQLKEAAVQNTRPSIAPGQMRDGKRYRVVFEGFRVTADCGCCQSFRADLDSASSEFMHVYDIDAATRIEEIGGEQ